MKYVIIALLLVFSVNDANAIVYCAAGVVRAGCVARRPVLVGAVVSRASARRRSRAEVPLRRRSACVPVTGATAFPGHFGELAFSERRRSPMCFDGPIDRGTTRSSLGK